MSEFLLCGFFTALYDLGERFIADTYTFIGTTAHLDTVLSTWMVAYIIWVGGKMVAGLSGVEELKRLVGVALVFTVALAFIRDYTLYRDWIYLPIENTALDLGMEIVRIASEDGTEFEIYDSTESASKYASMIAVVEDQVVRVSKFVWTIVSGRDVSVFSDPVAWASSNGFFIPRLLLGVILMLPYLFVVGLFVAFLIEALFKFVAMGFLAPIFIALMAFPGTRSFGLAAGRVLVGAALTIIFAAGATLQAIEVLAEHLIGRGEIIGGVFGEKLLAIILLVILAILFYLLHFAVRAFRVGWTPRRPPPRTTSSSSDSGS